MLTGDLQAIVGAKAVLLDLDGTVYLGDRLLPGSASFIEALADTGRKWLFITNNCSRTPGEYSRKLTALGIPTRPSEVFTSGELTARILAARGISRAFVLGTASLKRQFARLGVLHDTAEPQAVVASFDLSLTYPKLLAAVRFVQRGLPLYSTHPDLVCPTPEGPIPDSGLITGMIERTTGVKATVFGKPMPEMVTEAASRLGVGTGDTVFIGDRLYTDMRMACESGIPGVLVLSGETKAEDISQSPWQPSVVASSLAALVPLLRSSDQPPVDH